MTQPTHQYRRRKKIALVAAIAGLGLGLTACAGNDAAPIPAASETTSEPNATASPTAPSWADKYTERELTAYDAALDRWTEFETKSEPFWAAGKATPQAEDLFKRYYPSPGWQILYSQLDTYEKAEVKVTGIPTVLWSKAARIKLGPDETGSVTLVQCVDYRSQTTTQWGKATPRPVRFRKPIVRTIIMNRPKGFGWLVYESNLPPKQGYEPCTKDES